MNGTPKVVRRRLRVRLLNHLVGREASPPPKRRKWLILPGPFRGSQEDSLFPRVWVGQIRVAAWSLGTGSRRRRHSGASQTVWLKRGYIGTLFLIWCTLRRAWHKHARSSIHDKTHHHHHHNIDHDYDHNHHDNKHNNTDSHRFALPFFLSL